MGPEGQERSVVSKRFIVVTTVGVEIDVGFGVCILYW